MITYKFKIDPIDIKAYRKQYNVVYRYAYERLSEGKDETSIKLNAKELNNIDLLDASMIEFATKRAAFLFSRTKGEKVVHGGKSNFLRRKKNFITKEEFQEKKMVPLYLIGRASDNGNRKASLDIINNQQVVIKLNREIHIPIKIKKMSKNQERLLFKLEEQSRLKLASFSIGLTNDEISISFDETVDQNKEYSPIKNRILSIDQNPNYIGLSISEFDEKDNQIILLEKDISLKQINSINVRGCNSSHPKKKYKNNKRKHETFEIVKYIKNLAKHYRCNYVAIEDLSIKSSDKKKGKNFNKLVNNSWLRRDFEDNLQKWCHIENITLVRVNCAYTSFVGQMTHPTKVDAIAASLEIARRCYLITQFFFDKTRSFVKEKADIRWPQWNPNNLSTQWKKMIDENVILDWKSFYDMVKKTGKSYRFLIDESSSNFFRFKSCRSLIKIY